MYVVGWCVQGWFGWEEEERVVNPYEFTLQYWRTQDSNQVKQERENPQLPFSIGLYFLPSRIIDGSSSFPYFIPPKIQYHISLPAAELTSG